MTETADVIRQIETICSEPQYPLNKYQAKTVKKILRAIGSSVVQPEPRK